jgi:hypothetical protein
MSFAVLDVANYLPKHYQHEESASFFCAKQPMQHRLILPGGLPCKIFCNILKIKTGKRCPGFRFAQPD